MEPSNATQTLGGIEDDAAAGADATKRAASSVKLLAMLQPDGLALVSSNTSDNSRAQLELERSETGFRFYALADIMHHFAQWLCIVYLCSLQRCCVQESLCSYLHK